MAKYDPTEFDAISQAFLRDFYLFHKKSCYAWYIKNENHCFIDASIAFQRRFLPPDVTSIMGLYDTDISSAAENDVRIMYDLESNVTTQGEEISILASNYFLNISNIKSFILKMMPYHFSNSVGVIVFIYDLASFEKKTDWLSSLLPASRLTSPCAGTSDLPYFNPLPVVTEHEWTIAWLVICGCSLRSIGKMINMKRQSVELKISHAYMKLKVVNREGLLQMAECHGWINLIPKRFISASNIIKIG